MDDTVRRDRHHFRFRAERPGPEPAAFEVQLRFRWATAANFVLVRAVGMHLPPGAGWALGLRVS